MNDSQLFLTWAAHNPVLTFFICAIIAWTVVSIVQALMSLWANRPHVDEEETDE